MSCIKNNLMYLMFRSETYGTRAILGLSELLYGLTMVVMPSLMVRPSYEVLMALLPPTVWGILFIISGCLNLYQTLKLNNISRESHMIAGFSLVMWSFLFLASVYSGAFLAGEGVLTAIAVWIFVRAGSYDFNDNRSI